VNIFARRERGQYTPEVLAVECPYCGAQPEVVCKVKNGNGFTHGRSMRPHADRVTQAKEGEGKAEANEARAPRPHADRLTAAVLASMVSDRSRISAANLPRARFLVRNFPRGVTR
jgi:hypothetical protein